MSNFLLSFTEFNVKSWILSFPNFEKLLSSNFSALICFLGHIFPVWLKFKGGKGVAVYLGILVSFSINLSIFFIVSWLTILFFSKYSSLSSLISTLLIFIYTIIFKSFNESVFFFTIFIIIIYTHRENIVRLKNKKENKIKIYKAFNLI